MKFPTVVQHSSNYCKMDGWEGNQEYFQKWAEDHSSWTNTLYILSTPYLLKPKI